MTKSNGIKSLKQAAKLLNKHAPDGESLAYINPEEAKLLKSHGGSGIMTLSGVPSYDWWNPLSWQWTGDEGILDKAGDWLGYGGDEGGGKFLKDLSSIGGGYLGYKEAKELTDWEKQQYEQRQVKEALNTALFAAQTDQGKQLLTPQNVPSTIEDVSRFTEVDIPTMTTTAAQGGRIGYQHGSGNGNRYSYLVDKYNKGIPLTPDETKELQMLEITYADVDRDPSAHGGRIGYNLGGIDRPFQGIGALNPRMGYRLGEEVEQVTEEVITPFSKIPENIKMADLDNIPDWWLTDFEQLIEEFKGDNGGRSPQNLNDLEKWHRFKHGTASAPSIEDSQNEMSMNVFNKPYHQLNQEELDILNEMGSAAPRAQGIMQAARGGRIGAQKGGIMPLLNMGGMEKDYRQDGGFVPIGRREKADDVPARLSKNEFVFTADAVRAAGGGDIDQGAQRMYNVMKNLEAGGEISEQSQGQA
jgi:hypothetical protein